MKLNIRHVLIICAFCLFTSLLFCFFGYKYDRVDKKYSIEHYNSFDADKFVEAYTSGNIAVMKQGVIRDWCVSYILLDDCDNKKEYLAGMVFASERLVRLCKVQGNINEMKFWQQFRDDNISGLNDFSLPELIKAVDLLDAEMGVDFNRILTNTNIDINEAESIENTNFAYPVF